MNRPTPPAGKLRPLVPALLDTYLPKNASFRSLDSYPLFAGGLRPLAASWPTAHPKCDPPGRLPNGYQVIEKLEYCASMQSSFTAAQPGTAAGNRRTTGRVVSPVLTACAVSFATSIPLFGLPPTDDETFATYRTVGRFGYNIPRALFQGVGSVPTYARLGNVRPGGRVIEKFWESVNGLLLELGLTLPSILGIFRCALWAILAGVTFMVVRSMLPEQTNDELTNGMVEKRSMSARGRPLNDHVLAAAVGAAGAASGSQSSLFVYSQLYLTVSIGVISAPLLLMHLSRWRRASSMLYLGLGASIVLVNEVAALGLVATTVVSLLSRRPGLVSSSYDACFRSANKYVLLGAAPVVVLTRMLLFAVCRDGGCYAGSDIAISGDTPGLLLRRTIAAFGFFGGTGWVVFSAWATVAMGVLALKIVGGNIAARFRVIVGPTIFLGSILVASACYAALSRAIASDPSVQNLPWRESPLAAMGAAAILGLVLRQMNVWLGGAAVGLAAVAAAVSSVQLRNSQFDLAQTQVQLDVAEMVTSSSSYSNAEWCGVLALVEGSAGGGEYNRSTTVEAVMSYVHRQSGSTLRC